MALAWPCQVAAGSNRINMRDAPNQPFPRFYGVHDYEAFSRTHGNNRVDDPQNYEVRGLNGCSEIGGRQRHDIAGVATKHASITVEQIKARPRLRITRVSRNTKAAYYIRTERRIRVVYSGVTLTLVTKATAD